MRLFQLLLFTLFLAPASAQKNYVPPLKGALLVTGTFGELRSDHYHAGLDFRAPTGTPVYAVQEGFVSRVVVRGGGYGQAIYVDHPDGHRSVYGHLEALAPELLDTVRARQYAEEKFSQSLRFDSLAYPVERGQRIGAVGNRGHSFGPHLHFEMREIEGDVPLNPLLFGFSVPDRRAPRIQSLRVYELDADGHEITATTYAVGRTFPDTLFVNTPDVALGVKAYDRQDAMPNKNGPYRGSLYVDSTFQFGFEHARIPYEDTRYLNALTDYREWTARSSWFHKLWALPRVQSDVVKAGEGGLRGRLRLRAGTPLRGWVRVEDYAGNETDQAFVIVYRADRPRGLSHPHQYFLPAGEESLIERPGARVYFPADALYEDLYLQYGELPDASDGRLSSTVQLHNPLTPLHRPVHITLTPNRTPADSLKGHVYLGSCSEDGRYSSQGGEWTDDGRFTTTVHSFGDYALFLDTTPPTVQINSFPTNLSRYKGFSVLIEDDVSGGGLDYRGTVDGEWVLLEYDAKNDKLTHTFDHGDVGRGRHRFELTVRDARGNSTTWARNFTR